MLLGVEMSGGVDFYSNFLQGPMGEEVEHLFLVLYLFEQCYITFS
jgi:hypothetical protein